MLFVFALVTFGVGFLKYGSTAFIDPQNPVFSWIWSIAAAFITMFSTDLFLEKKVNDAQKTSKETTKLAQKN